MIAVARDPYGLVLLVSPDGKRFRTVKRLTETADEAVGLFVGSRAPTLSVADLTKLYGGEIAMLRLGSA